MSAALYAIYGASGFGREVLPLARAQLEAAGIPRERLVFVDDNPTVAVANGHRVLTYREYVGMSTTERYVVIAIADSHIRERLAERCSEDGVQLWSVTAANVISMDEVRIGKGAILSPFVTLTTNIDIGSNFHGNIYSYVAHDCRIGNFVTFAPAVKCNGNVHIEDHAYIGTGAILKHGQPGKPLIIGAGAIVGMGAVVTRDVAAGTTVVGNPARPLTKTC